MGIWSRLAADVFIDWLTPRAGLRWIDIGCGSGAFTELLVERCAPAEVQGIDPSEGQLAFARTRPDGDFPSLRSSPRTSKRHNIPRLADPQRLGGADRLADVAGCEMSVMLFDHAGIGMAEVARHHH